MKRAYVFMTALLVSSYVFADVPPPGVFLPVPGGLAGTPFAEPSFLFGDDPRAAAWNPAAGADRELPAFGAAAGLAFPSGSGEGLGGYTSLSASIPTSIGTAWAIVDGVLAAPYLRAWSAPTGTSFVAGLSKRASDRLSVGIGAGAAVADIDGFEWTIGASLGAELAVPELAPAGSELSFALLAAGPAVGGNENVLPLIAATPIVSLNSRLVETGSFSVSATALLAAPAFSDLAFAAGASFSLGPYWSLDLGWHWSVASAGAWSDGEDGSDDQAFHAFPSLTIRFDGSSRLRLGGYGTALGASYRPSGDGASVAEGSAVFSRGERDDAGPEVMIAGGSPTVFSPRLVDKIHFPFAVRDASRIVAWKAVVYGPDGDPIHVLGTDVLVDSPPGILQRLISKKKTLDIPRTLEIPLSPSPADGEYRIRAWARDEYGNEGNAAEYAFVIDGTVPSASAQLKGFAVISPNGDGVRDALEISQEGSDEGLWTGTFFSSEGKAVRVFRWTDGPPSSFSWEGKGDAGETLGDGEYVYVLEAVDGAGNRGSVRVTGIILDAEETPLSISLEGTALSTDRDARATSILLKIDAKRKRGLSTWKVSVVGDGGRQLRTWSGSSDRLDIPPLAIRFDGRTQAGDPIPDGRYRFRVDFEYTNGNRPSAISAPFVVDSKRPSGRIRATSQTIIMDRGSSVSLHHSLSTGADWRGLVMDESDAVVRVILLGGNSEAVVEWNGLDAAGLPVGEGRYRYVAEGTNLVGLVGTTPPVTIFVERGGRAASLIADRQLFSATVGDGRVRFLPRLERRDRIVSYALDIRNSASKTVVRRFDGIATVPIALSWDGSDSFGTPVADGDYVAALSVLFEDGERMEAESAPVSLDSTPPRAALSLASPIFSPNGDGVLDRMDISHREIEGAALWTGTVLDMHDAVVRTYSWKDKPPDHLSWDGRDEDGGLFPDGAYKYRLASVDEAGNSYSAETPIFRLDARVPTVIIAVDKKAFSPNGDGFADSLLVRLVPGFTDGLSSWSVNIADATGKTTRSISYSPGSSPSASSVPPKEFRWDGSGDGGKRVTDGNYKAVVELGYAKGDRIRVESASFLVDSTPPAVSVTLSPLPFSPDGDGEADELFIDLKAEDSSPIAGWMLSIMDPTGYPFTTFSGKTVPPEPFSWNGSNLEGDLVEAAQDYKYELIVRDALGNAGKVSGIVPVDVFVLRDGDKLKIRVSSIEFAPSSASLSVGDPLIDAKNVAVLDRIATVLARYPGYRIRVEGHAVNVSGTEREERSELVELSLSRAQTVLAALVDRGVEPARIEAKGLGGREPLVPHGDLGARWRNRRVEFILVR